MMKQLINIAAIIILGIVITLTGVFTGLQLKRSQTIDERLVSSLETTLDIKAIQQAITKITAPARPPQ